MKSISTIIILSTFILMNSMQAQLLRSIGVKAGIVAANQNWNYSIPGIDIGSQTRWGYDFGVFTEWLNIPWISIIAEVHYIQKGFTTKIAVTTEASPDGTGEYLTYSPHVDYTSIPILLKIRKDLSGISVYVIAGPTYDILVDKESSMFGIVLDNFRKTELCATFGFGAEVALVSEIKIGTEIRYSPSIQNSYSTQNLTVNNRCIELLFVCRF